MLKTFFFACCFRFYQVPFEKHTFGHTFMPAWYLDTFPSNGTGFWES